MIDIVAVNLIVVGAIAYIAYRYGFKKSGGCTCGCEKVSRSGGCCGNGTKSDSACSRHN